MARRIRARSVWPFKATGNSIRQLAKAASRKQLSERTQNRLEKLRHRRGLRGNKTEGFAQ